jgi:chaperone modulatory protein CbpM
MQAREFSTAAHIRIEMLNSWIEAGWLMPGRDKEETFFSAIDLARVQLIRDLQRMGVNDEAVPIVLDLIDQMHGLRRTLRTVLAEAAPADKAH